MSSILPDLHRDFAERFKIILQKDERFHSLLAGGSLVHGGFDEYSDLDFVVVVELAFYGEILNHRIEFAKKLGILLHAFTGEHVGEPRLLICLFGPKLLHVDLKFITLDMLTQRVEDPAILFTRDHDALAHQLAQFKALWPNMTPEWFEARVWVWLHYATTKLARGELFEALGMLSFFREQVLGPMLHRRAGIPQRSVRRIETFGIDPEGLLTSTVATYGHDSVSKAIRNAMVAYTTLRADMPPANIIDDAAAQALLVMLNTLDNSN
ncbi:nucleotidyltransferase domain-containing protein [Serratia plymuthica]|uniref:nucleotidyltransferase domain-containing protein n=1 Tax=Serratia plymuthica TaxID=82996 RepID=UPI003DA20C31